MEVPFSNGWVLFLFKFHNRFIGNFNIVSTYIDFIEKFMLTVQKCAKTLYFFFFFFFFGKEIEKWQLSHDLSLLVEKKKKTKRSNNVDDEDDVDDEERVDPETQRRMKKERDRAVAEQPLKKWKVAGYTRGLRFRCAQLRPGIEYGFRVSETICRKFKSYFTY